MPRKSVKNITKSAGNLFFEIVEDELFSRSGLNDAWVSIDDDIRDEIKLALVNRFDNLIADLLVNHG